MPLEHGEEHGEGGEAAHVNESPERPDTPESPGGDGGGRRVRGDLLAPTTELVAEAVIDAYEQAHYDSRAREYPLQAHHWNKIDDSERWGEKTSHDARLDRFSRGS